MRRSAKILTLAAGYLAGAELLKAQPILPGLPDFYLTPPALQEALTNNFDVFKPTQPGVPTAEAAEESKPIELGPVQLRPHLFYRSYYASGILMGRGDTVESWINEISPGIFMGLGRYISVDYTPTIRLYSSGHLNNGVDHSVLFTAGGQASPDWILSLSQGYNKTSTPEVETAVQTVQELYSTALKASHDINERMSLDLGLNQDFRLME